MSPSVTPATVADAPTGVFAAPAGATDHSNSAGEASALELASMARTSSRWSPSPSGPNVVKGSQSAKAAPSSAHSNSAASSAVKANVAERSCVVACGRSGDRRRRGGRVRGRPRVLDRGRLDHPEAVGRAHAERVLAGLEAGVAHAGGAGGEVLPVERAHERRALLIGGERERRALPGGRRGRASSSAGRSRSTYGSRASRRRCRPGRRRERAACGRRRRGRSRSCGRLAVLPRTGVEGALEGRRRLVGGELEACRDVGQQLRRRAGGDRGLGRRRVRDRERPFCGSRRRPAATAWSARR